MVGFNYEKWPLGDGWVGEEEFAFVEAFADGVVVGFGGGCGGFDGAGAGVDGAISTRAWAHDTLVCPAWNKASRASLRAASTMRPWSGSLSPLFGHTRPSFPRSVVYNRTIGVESKRQNERAPVDDRGGLTLCPFV
jgi:hypothetical protein